MTDEITGRVLTYVEYELDYFRPTRFEYAVDGVAPPYWTLGLGVNNATLLGVADDALPSGKGIEVARTTSLNLGAVHFDPIPTTEIEDGSILVFLRRTAGLGNPGVILRGVQNGVDDFDGYVVRVSETEVRIDKVDGGAVTDFADEDIAVDLEVGVWIRAEAITIDFDDSVLVRAKVWSGSAGDEPLFYTIDFFDEVAEFENPGFFALYANDVSNTTWQCGYFRVRALFASVTDTYRHVTSSDYVPRVPAATPDLLAVSYNPTELSLGEQVSKHAKVTINFKDHRDADHGEGFDVGTKWGKFRAKDLFRRGTEVRIINTLLEREFFDTANEEFFNDPELSDILHFVFESFDGPTLGGGFSFLAQGVLKLADNDRAQCPVATNGFLSAGLNAGATSFTVSPSGIGDLEYPTSGYVAIGGKEIVGFDRSGDTFQNLDRGQWGTEDQDHAAEDRVQLCHVFDADTPAEIIAELLQNFAGVDGSFINQTEWDNEVATYLNRLYTRLVAEPTGVNKLISELIQQAGLILWHEPTDGQVKLRVLRNSPTIATYDQGNTIEGSIQVREQLNKRVTQVLTYYGVRNPLDPLDEPNNYRSSLLTVDSEGESIHGEAIVKKIHGTWIPEFARTTAERVNNLQLGRFSTPPRRISFDVMRHSGIELPQLAEVYGVGWWGNQDELGIPRTATVQVVRINPLADRYQVDAEEMFFSPLFDTELETARVITIDSDTNNIELVEIHNAIYPEVTEDDLAATTPVTVTFIISEGVTIWSNSTDEAAVYLGDEWPDGLQITIINNGRIQGRGGNGGNMDSNDPNIQTNKHGLNGGPALAVDFPCELQNNGEIWGGGGGGGAGISPLLFCGAGGGAGDIPGTGGYAAGLPPERMRNGNNGTTENGGSGGAVGNAFGGNGGDPGQNGNNGGGTGQGMVQPGNGGSAGAGVDGNSLVSYNPEGDIRGPQIG